MKVFKEWERFGAKRGKLQFIQEFVNSTPLRKGNDSGERGKESERGNLEESLKNIGGRESLDLRERGEERMG